MNVALPIVAPPPRPEGAAQPDGTQPDRSSAGVRHHLEVDRVWKSYTTGVHVVRDVSFTLGQGEFLTLLGPSGSGKTSTLMMVAGFEAPRAARSASTGVTWRNCRPSSAISAWCSRATRCSRT